MSASHSRFGPSAVKSRRTRSSCDGVPGLVALRLLGLLVASRGEVQVDRPPAVVPTEAPHHPVRYLWVITGADLVGQEPVAELGVVAMGVEDRVGEVRLLPLAGGDRLVEPPVVGGAGETEYPTRHHDRDPVDGELAHERVHHPFGS